MAKTVTLTFTDAEAARVLEALGAKLGLNDAQGQRRSATAAEAKQFVVNVLAQEVHDHFLRKGTEALAKPAPLAVT